MAKVGKVLYFLLIMGLLLPIVLVGLLMLYLSAWTFLIQFVIVLYIALGVFLYMSVFDVTKHVKITQRIVVGIIAVSLLFTIPGFYHQTRPVIGDGYLDMTMFEPFVENTKAVYLDQPSTYTIEDNLPVLDGATALYPIYSAFAQAVYPEDYYPIYQSEVMSNRTGEAYENLIYGRADIIFVFAPSDEQMANAKRIGKEMTFTPIGKEAFVFFTHAKNPVKNLSTDKIKGIYSGDITNWKEVGGKNKSIRAFQRPENTGSQSALQRFMGDTPIMKPPVEDIASLMGTMIDQVSSYKNYNNSIGYTFRYYSNEMVGNHNVRLLSVNGIEPTVASIQSGAYPITDEIYAVTAGSDNPHIEEFLQWILSNEGQEIVEKTGYVPIGE